MRDKIINGVFKEIRECFDIFIKYIKCYKILLKWILSVL